MIAIKDEVLNDLVVVKRSGQRVSFNPLKIAIAIKNAFDSVDNNYTNKDTNVVYSDVLKFITSNYQDRKTINVEDVQNIIEDILRHDGYEDVYASFSSYRVRRNESRKNFQEKQQHKFARAIEKINYLNSTKLKTKDALKEYGNIVSHEYTKAYILDNKYVRASKEGIIYIHNMDFFNYGYLGNTFLDINNDMADGDFYDLINIVINSAKEIKGEVSIPSLDKCLIKNAKNMYQQAFIKLLNKYLNNMGFGILTNNKKIEERILREEGISIDINNYSDVFNNSMLQMVFNNAKKDSLEYIEEYYRVSIDKLLKIINSNDSQFSISFGNNTNEYAILIEDIIYETILNNEYLDNVTSIYKIKDLEKAVKLVVANKNIRLSFVDNDCEFFGDGSRIYENLYSDNLSLGRMNVCNTSINLARIGIKYQKLNDLFYQELDNVIDLAKNELMVVFENIGDKTKDNYDYLFNKTIYDSDKLDYGQKIRKVIKNGTLNINLSGLLECAKAISSDNYLEVVLKIIKYIHKKLLLLSIDSKLNFTLSHIVNVSSMEFMDIDKAIFGNISNNEYYENLGSISKLDKIEDLNRVNKLLTGGFLLDININNKDYEKEVRKILEKLKDTYTGVVSVRRKL